MSVSLILARPKDIDRLARMVADYHAFENIDQSDDEIRAALAPLLEDSPHGAAYLAGPPNSPIGYIILSFGYSVELGGIDGFVDELYIRPAVRGRGIGGEILQQILPAMAAHGVKALHLEVAHDNTRAQSLYQRHGFRPREKYHLMTRTF